MRTDRLIPSNVVSDIRVQSIIVRRLCRRRRLPNALAVQQIVIEEPRDDTGLWSAILDRLRRATHSAPRLNDADR